MHDFDLDRREVRFRRAISTDYDGSLLEKDIKTHASRRLALDEGTVGLLRQHRLRQREEALALGVPLADDALLFTRGDGKPWRPDVCTNRFDRLRATLGLEHVRLHDMRHFVASVLIDGGIPISTVSKRLGHSQMSTTLNIYTHALPGHRPEGRRLHRRPPQQAQASPSRQRLTSRTATSPPTIPARTHWQVHLREPAGRPSRRRRGSRTRQVARERHLHQWLSPP